MTLASSGAKSQKPLRLKLAPGEFPAARPRAVRPGLHVSRATSRGRASTRPRGWRRLDSGGRMVQEELGTPGAVSAPASSRICPGLHCHHNCLYLKYCPLSFYTLAFHFFIYPFKSQILFFTFDAVNLISVFHFCGIVF